MLLLSTSVLGSSKSEDTVDVPANQTGNSVHESTIIIDKLRKELIEVAKSAVPGAKDSEVESLAPSYTNDGLLDGFVITLNFPPFTGTFDVPGQEVLVANGQDYIRQDQNRYVVDSLRRLFVGVDLQTKVVEWVSPALSQNGEDGTIISYETITKSSFDDTGKFIPPNARVKKKGLH